MPMPKDFKFKSWRFDRFDFPSEPGSRKKITYTPVFDKNGVLSLEATGEEDIYEYIQANADYCNLNIIMERVRATGDVSILNRVQGFYMDASELPDNWPEVINSVNALKDGFEKMPTDFKELYGNDFVRFAANFDPAQFSDLASGSGVPGSVDQVDAAQEVKEVSDES